MEYIHDPLTSHGRLSGKAIYPNVEFSLSYFGAVTGTHLGEGGMGMGWMKK